MDQVNYDKYQELLRSLRLAVTCMKTFRDGVEHNSEEGISDMGEERISDMVVKFTKSLEHIR